MKFLLSIALPAFLLDQATKWWVVRNFEFDGPPREVVPGFFYLVHWGNTGAAFSMFRNSNTGFVVLSLVAFVALIFAFLRGIFRDRASRWGVALLLGGILGNVTDRLIHHHVVDFLLFDLHVRFANPWPAFNVADTCICIAAGLFIIGSFQAEKTARAEN